MPYKSKETSNPQGELVYARQGGFVKIDAGMEAAAGHTFCGAYSRGMDPCQPFIITNNAKGPEARLVFCHIDPYPARLNLLPSLLDWASDGGKFEVTIHLTTRERGQDNPYNEATVRAWANSDPAAKKIQFSFSRDIDSGCSETFVYFKDDQFHTVLDQDKLPVDCNNLGSTTGECNPGRWHPKGYDLLSDDEFGIEKIGQPGFVTYSSDGGYSTMQNIQQDLYANLTKQQEELLLALDQPAVDGEIKSTADILQVINKNPGYSAAAVEDTLEDDLSITDEQAFELSEDEDPYSLSDIEDIDDDLDNHIYRKPK